MNLVRPSRDVRDVCKTKKASLNYCRMVSKHYLILIKDQDLEKPTGHRPVKISFLSLELPTLHDTLHIRSCNANIKCLRFLHMNITPYKCSKFRFILSSSIYHSLMLKTQNQSNWVK